MTIRAAVLIPLVSVLFATFAPATLHAAAGDVSTYVTIPSSQPFGVEPGPDGFLYVTGPQSASSGKVWKVGPGGSPIIEFASGLSEPKGMAFDASGNLYVADWLDRIQPARIWKITPDGTKSTFATVTGASFLEFNNAGNLLVSTWGSLTIRSVTPAGAVSNYATGISVPGEEVTGLVYDRLTDELYFGAGPSIKKVGPGGSPVSTLAGNMVGVIGLERGAGGEFYVSRYSHRDIYEVTPGGAESIFAGVHLGSGCIDGPRLGGARFQLPGGLAMLGSTLLIADAGCHAIRSIDLTGPTPTTRSSWGRLKTIYR